MDNILLRYRKEKCIIELESVLADYYYTLDDSKISLIKQRLKKIKLQIKE